jgi:dihydroxyacetone kinase
MKKILQCANDIIPDMLSGFALSALDVELIPKYRIVKRRDINAKKISLVSGGGSGHEPAHAGFVGSGMLDAAVCGDVFASPSQVQIYQAIRSVATEKGVLLIVKNYSGDIMNFQNAAYMAREDGIAVEFVKVADDLAVQDSLYTVGRRGVAGPIFVHKIAGAAAEQCKSLAEVKAIAEKTIANVRSIGFAFSSCTVPAKGSPTFVLPDDEMEYGVGIHGEPGIQRERMVGAKDLADRMVSSLTQELSIGDADARVALLVNGFGASPMMELYILNRYVVQALLRKSITVAGVLVGNYMTSIDMAGASVSLLKLDDELESLLNRPCATTGLRVDAPFHVIKSGDDGQAIMEKSETPNQSHVIEDIGGSEQTMLPSTANYEIETPAACALVGDQHLTLDNIIYFVDAISACAIRNEQAFCDLDSFAGDGDFGMSLAKGFRQLKREWPDIMENHSQNISSFLATCALVIMEHCGGASGPIWGAAFRSAGKSATGKTHLSVKAFSEMLDAAITGIQGVGERSFGRGAVVGDKTLIDALIPCADVWHRAAESCETDFLALFKLGAEAACKGAKATEAIVARLGRAGVVGERSLGHPDAGAHAIGVIFTELAGLLSAR